MKRYNGILKAQRIAALKAAIKFGEDFPRDEEYLERLRQFEARFSLATSWEIPPRGKKRVRYCEGK